jgi:membrane-bound ClpP family serine protease
VAGKGEGRINRQFDRIERKVPLAAKLLEWLRRPASQVIRIPIGVLLILGGIFSFLPVLGIWMLPLGLLLLALDIAFLRTPVAGVIVRATRKWMTWRRSQRNSPREG